MKKPAASIATKAATPTPAPMPAFAPVESPPSLESDAGAVLVFVEVGCAEVFVTAVLVLSADEVDCVEDCVDEYTLVAALIVA